MRQDLHAWLATADFKRILDAFAKSSRTLSALITFTYSENPLVCWRAIDAVGRVAERYCSARPPAFRNYLQRLFWMMSDEAGIVAPHAPELIGEIVRSDTNAFGEFIPLTVSLLNLEPEDLPLFLPGILYALWRIGQVFPVASEEAFHGFEAALRSKDPRARAMAVRCLSLPDCREALLQHPELEEDTEKVRIYREGELYDTSIARLYRELSPRGIRTPP